MPEESSKRLLEAARQALQGVLAGALAVLFAVEVSGPLGIAAVVLLALMAAISFLIAAIEVSRARIERRHGMKIPDRKDRPR